MSLIGTILSIVQRLRHSEMLGRDEASAHPASAIINTPAGGIAATDVQAALNELDGDKSIVGHTHTGSPESKLAQANTHESADTDSASTALHHTLGTGANNACAGNDSRLSDARTPTSHASSHNAGGGDALAIDAVAGTGSLRTLGTAATAACAGNDSRLSDARTPTAHAATHTNGTDDIQSATAAQKGLATAAQITKLDGIEALADVTDAANVNSAGAVMESDYDANTILAANTDNTPAALTVAEQRLVGRVTGGNIDDLTITQALDMAGTAEQGDIAYRGASAWALLPHGTGTQALLTGGHGANPAWATIREVLTAARTYYVRTDGSDSNNGLANTAGGAFLTINKAIDVVSALDVSTYSVTIQVGNGTYTGAVTLKNAVGSGTITLKGDSTTPANVLISVTSNQAIYATNITSSWVVDGFELRTTTSGNCLYVIGDSTVSVKNLQFGASAGYHFVIGGRSTIYVTGDYTISGSPAGVHWYVVENSLLSIVAPRTITLSGTPNFSTAFAVATRIGMIVCYSITFSGSGTGPRYNLAQNSVIDTNGGGATYLPGNSAGSAATGGQYI